MVGRRHRGVEVGVSVRVLSGCWSAAPGVLVGVEVTVAV
jgi:hypothetical protein